MSTVTGSPAGLERYSTTTLDLFAPVDDAATDLSATTARYNAAPNDLQGYARDLGPAIRATADACRTLDALPAVLGAALRHVDQSGATILTASEGAIQQAVASGDVDNSFIDAVQAFLLGDVASLWQTGSEGGSLAAAVVRAGRTGVWVNALRRTSGMPRTLAQLRLLAQGNPATLLAAGKFPTFNTGIIGRGFASGLQRLPVERLANAGRWLGTPAATTALRRLGVAGGAYGTVSGAANLWQQGNPIDAFEREGAGYVADVAETAFSASSTAFLLAPNPVTGGVVIVTGVVWAGAEIVDHWDDISAGADRFADAAGDFAGDVGSTVVDAYEGSPVESVVEGASDLAGKLNPFD